MQHQNHHHQNMSMIDNNKYNRIVPTSSVFSDDPDSFMIGDRVWVQGIKPGYIVYIGDVQFAKGEWAGIVLDKAEGKNDGSVHGGKMFFILFFKNFPEKNDIFFILKCDSNLD